MKLYLVLPIIIPLVCGAVSLLFWRRPGAQKLINVAGSLLLLVNSIALLVLVREQGIQVYQIGNWQAPFGITFVADLLSTIMVVATGIIAVAVSIFSLAAVEPAHERYGYTFFFQVLLMGVCGSFLTGDLFNLYVWFEVMLTSSFALIVLGGKRMQVEGALKYVIINLLSSVLLLTGAGILYSIMGTLNMADLAFKLKSVNNPDIITLVSILFLLSFGIKAAIFPLFYWLPTSYHTPPIATTAIFAGLLTKVGVYSLLRMFTLLFTQNTDITHQLILILSVFTMVIGVFGALAQMDFRRLLSFHMISQIGYMTMGLGTYTTLALAGSIYYLVHNMIAKTNLFLVSGAANRILGSYNLEKIGGLYKAFPLLAFMFLMSALSLGGIPPFSGFFAKLTVFKAGLESEQYGLMAISIIVSLLTLLSMLKIWEHVFWKPNPESDPIPPESVARAKRPSYLLPIVGLSLLTLAMGLAAQPLFVIAMEAAKELMDPAQYIRAVLGAAP